MKAPGVLTESLIYLSAMVVTVPIAKKMGLGAVLGYLLAGSLLGPHLFGLLVGAESEALHLAEFGIIMMLFLIGLELQPSLLWKLRGPILGLGGSQVLLTSFGVLLFAVLLGMPWNSGMALGMILSLSSTAIVLQTLQEKGLSKTTAGENVFSVLLFQDIAVIPILAILPFLATLNRSFQFSSALLQFGKIIGAVLLVIGTGRFLIRPLFRAVAAAKLRELFTAMALLLILGTTALMHAVDLSPALGAFLAGVVLAESEYRHQLEVDIEPFKGLLLGVFFISVGAGIDYHLIISHPAQVVGWVIGLILLKFAILYFLARYARMSRPDTFLFSLALAQGGEFAFVLLNFTSQSGLFPAETSKLWTAAIAISMALAPVLIQFYIRVIEPKYMSLLPPRRPDEIDEKDNPVIVAGLGRFGQTVARLLRSSGFKVTVLDYDAEQVETLRRFGLKSFYGDASQMDLLHSAGIEHARLLVLAIDDYEKTTAITEEVMKRFPRVRIMARVYDRIHAYKLIHRGVEHVYIETSGSALNMGMDALKILGVPAKRALQMAQIFKRSNEKSIRDLARAYHEEDEASFITQAKGWLEALEKMLKNDQTHAQEEADRGWESAPRNE